MFKFEVGKTYRWADGGLDCITVIKRTAKCIVVKYEHSTPWRMLIRQENGMEYVTDSSVPRRWQDLYTCFADDEIK